MKTALALAVVGTIVVAATATTALAASRANRVSVSYVPPKNPAHQRIYERLKERKVLETLQRLLSPFRLPRTLKISLAGCDGEADAFYGDAAITICYEYIDDLWKNMPAETTPAGVAPIDTVAGPLFDTSLHEVGHALFDMLKLPVFGREEDAADQVAAYITLQFGEAEARRVILGTAYAYKTEAENTARPPSLTQFAGEHGTPAQRLFNLICIAYGAEAKLFSDVAKHLPAQRARGCEDEYLQVQYAFETLIEPHIDRTLADRIFDGSWLPKPTAKLPPRPGEPAQSPPQ
jgi:hypothetical protein